MVTRPPSTKGVGKSEGKPPALPKGEKGKAKARREMVRSTLPAAPPLVGSGSFAAFRLSAQISKKWFFGRLETQNCRKEDFWQKNTRFCYLSSSELCLHFRIEPNGVCSEAIVMRKKLYKNLCCLQSPSIYILTIPT